MRFRRFVHFPESFETYANPSLNKIVAKLNFLSKLLLKKSPCPRIWLCPNDGHADPPPLKNDHLKKVVMNGAECSE